MCLCISIPVLSTCKMATESYSIDFFLNIKMPFSVKGIEKNAKDGGAYEECESIQYLSIVKGISFEKNYKKNQTFSSFPKRL